jgi:adenylylsulfate kinase
MSGSRPDPLFTPLRREEREAAFRQRARVIWLFGLSGAGKTTLAVALERQLTQAGRMVARLDGDDVRAGLNQDLGFSDRDRTENLRRVAEASRLFVHSGMIVIGSFITPLRAQREMIRRIIGMDDLVDIHVEASFAVCASRDPKGLYARAEANQLHQFTGRDSSFEPPMPGSCRFVLNTERDPAEVSARRLAALVGPLVTAGG